MTKDTNIARVFRRDPPKPLGNLLPFQLVGFREFDIPAEESPAEIDELDMLDDDPAAGRIRRPGAGRKKVSHPTLRSNRT